MSDMAFKRSAVRSRLSPSRLEIARFQAFFLYIAKKIVLFWISFPLKRNTLTCGTPAIYNAPTIAEHPFGLNRYHLVYCFYCVFFNVIQFTKPLESRSCVVLWTATSRNLASLCHIAKKLLYPLYFLYIKQRLNLIWISNHNHRPCRWFAQAPLGHVLGWAYRLVEKPANRTTFTDCP